MHQTRRRAFAMLAMTVFVTPSLGMLPKTVRIAVMFLLLSFFSPSLSFYKT
jgi:hypothetical protein